MWELDDVCLRGGVAKAGPSCFEQPGESVRRGLREKKSESVGAGGCCRFCLYRWLLPLLLRNGLGGDRGGGEKKNGKRGRGGEEGETGGRLQEEGKRPPQRQLMLMMRAFGGAVDEVLQVQQN